MKRKGDECRPAGHTPLTTADMLALVQKDLEIYQVILGDVKGEIYGPEKCRVALQNVREGLSRSSLALSMVASYAENMRCAGVEADRTPKVGTG